MCENCNKIQNELDVLNSKHNPPLDHSELELIISHAEKAEHNNMTRHIEDARSVVEKLKGKPIKLKMQEITPTYENKPIEFDCMITAVGERFPGGGRERRCRLARRSDARSESVPLPWRPAIGFQTALSPKDQARRRRIPCCG